MRIESSVQTFHTIDGWISIIYQFLYLESCHSMPCMLNYMVFQERNKAKLESIIIIQFTHLRNNPYPQCILSASFYTITTIVNPHIIIISTVTDKTNTFLSNRMKVHNNQIP